MPAPATPVFTIVDAQSQPQGEAVEATVLYAGIGRENGLSLYFAQENADGMRVGWDDAALQEAGVQMEMAFEDGFRLDMWSDAPAQCTVRFYLSATEDWSDAGDPPYEMYAILIFEQAEA